ncbi:hypothetical protein D3C87_960140 [compost metagenome]
MAGGADHPAMIILERQVVGARPVKGQGETFIGCREFAFAGALVLQTHPAIAARRNGVDLLAFAGVAEGNLVTHRAEALRRAQAEIRRATIDEDFLGGLDPIRRTVAGKHGEHVATRFVRCRQIEGRIALGVGGQFGAGQLHRKLPEVLQFVVDHRQLLGAQAQAQFRIGHRFSVRVQQHQAALDRFACAVILLGQVERNLEVRLDVFSHAEGAAVSLILVVETQFIATGHSVIGQLESALGASLGIELQIEGLQRRAGRIQHGHIDVGRAWLHRVPRVLELPPDDFQRHPIPRPIQRPVGEGIEFGVVDFAVVVEILGDEHPALFVFADHERALGADVFQAQQAVGIGGAAAHYTEAIGPQHIDLRYRAAFVFARGPHQQFVTGDLAHRHGVGDEHHGGRAVLADQRFHQIQTRFEIAQRDVDVARRDADELAGRPGQVHPGRWLDRLGLPQRITELADHRQTRYQRELRLRIVGRWRGHRVAHLQFRHFLGDLFTRLVGKRPLHHPTGFAIPVVPQVREGVGQTFTLELAIADHSMQVLLALEEIQRLVDAIHPNVGAAVGLHAKPAIVAARRFEAHHRRFIAGKTAVGQQEKTLAGHRRITAGRDRVFGVYRRERQHQYQHQRQKTQHAGTGHWERKFSR